MCALNISETRCQNSLEIDKLSTLDIIRVINDEDKRVAEAVGLVADDIAHAADAVYECLRSSGRLIYIGAGTSGRLGVLDASECPPTYGTDPGLVIGRIAGGFDALLHAVEGAEDDEDAGRALIDELAIGTSDAVVGISASGGAPYVVAAVEYARSRGALTVGIVNNPATRLHAVTDICIAPIVGAEVITGSTRMKSGTAQKLVLNMLSTTVMIKLGKVYGNLMVDMQATNDKLKKRAVRIVSQAADTSLDAAEAWLQKANGEVKTAIVMAKCGISSVEARCRLEMTGGILRAAIENAEDVHNG